MSLVQLLSPRQVLPCIFLDIFPLAAGLKKSEVAEYYFLVTVDKLKDGLSIFDQQFALAVAQGKTAQSTGKNYRSALKQFISWMEKQPWWQGLFPDAVVRVAPLRKQLSPMPKEKRGKQVRYSPNFSQTPRKKA